MGDRLGLKSPGGTGGADYEPAMNDSHGTTVEVGLSGPRGREDAMFAA